MCILPAGVSSTDVMKMYGYSAKVLEQLFLHRRLGPSPETLRPSGCVNLERGTIALLADLARNVHGIDPFKISFPRYPAHALNSAFVRCLCIHLLLRIVSALVLDISFIDATFTAVSGKPSISSSTLSCIRLLREDPVAHSRSLHIDYSSAY